MTTNELRRNRKWQAMWVFELLATVLAVLGFIGGAKPLEMFEAWAAFSTWNFGIWAGAHVSARSLGRHFDSKGGSKNEEDS